MSRCRECRLNFTPCAAAKNWICWDWFKSLLTIVATKIESKLNELHPIIKNCVNFRLALVISRGMTRCIASTMNKMLGHIFQLKDGEGI